jgi:hypothetical protein
MNNKELNIFERFLFEAPGDEVPPDMVDNAPEVPEGAENDPAPPDLPDAPDMDSGGEGISDDAPPDMPEEFADDEFTGDDQPMEEPEDPNNKLQNIGLDGKISAIMNQNLYQRYLALLNNIGGQLTMIKNNSDILYTLSSDSLSIIDSLKKLDENIRLYLKNYFINENYSKNLLFFNKCLNLLKLLNDVFDSDIKKGTKAIQ